MTALFFLSYAFWGPFEYHWSHCFWGLCLWGSVQRKHLGWRGPNCFLDITSPFQAVLDTRVGWGWGGLEGGMAKGGYPLPCYPLLQPVGLAQLNGSFFYPRSSAHSKQTGLSCKHSRKQPALTYSTVTDICIIQASKVLVFGVVPGPEPRYFWLVCSLSPWIQY